MTNDSYSVLQNHSHHSKWSPVEQNCRPNWPIWTCIVANVSGLGSTTLWFLVLLPQLWKNFRRKSVRGLSILWATANFTASLINIFFVFMYVNIPLYGQISSVYCPILEFGLMLQFWFYGNYDRHEKILFAVGCIVVWGAIIVLELIVRLGELLEYAAIFLWSVETFPQIILNMKLHSTSGQSSISAVIASLGKTTDFIATNGLVMPLQYVIMRYFSSSVAYVNGLQVAWYLGNGKNVMNTACLNPDQSLDNSTDSKTASIKQRPFGHDYMYNTESALDTRSTGSKVKIITIETKQTSALILIRWTCLFVLVCLLVGCVIGFSWNIGSYYGLFAPLSIVIILTMAKLYLIKCRSKDYAIQSVN